MANIRSIIFFYIISITSISNSKALYEDQIGKFDWKLSFIGKVQHARFDNKRIIVTTEENILASLNAKNGHIQWRQLLENPVEQQIQLLHVAKDIVTVSGAKNSFYVRGWDSASGNILWEWTIYTERTTADSFWGVQGDKLIHVIVVPGSQLESTVYNVRNGDNNGKSSKIPASWLGDSSRNCVLSVPYFACLSADKQIYYLNVIGDGNLQTFPLQSIIEPTSNLQLLEFEAPKPSLLLILSNSDAKILEIDGEIRVLPYNVEPSAVYLENFIYQLEINKENPEKLIKVTWKHSVTGQEQNSIEINYPLGLGAPYILAANCRGASCDLLLSSTDDALSLVPLQEGKIAWTREEALSQIISVEFFELPVSELDASIENEFKTSTGDIISMLSHRLSTQSKQLYNLLFGGQLLSSNGLVRDEFGLHKIIVVATSVGKLFAIDTLTGSIVWSYRLPNVSPFTNNNLNPEMLLLVQRTARYAPLPAQCILLAKDSNTGNGILFKFDPITGISREGIQRLNYRFKQALVLPYFDQNYVRPVLVVANDDNVHIYPSNDETLVTKYSESIFLYTVEARNSFLRGYKIVDGSKIQQIWQVDLGPSTTLEAVSTRPTAEHVHSQGRVLPDRSVYYKYVNPNLIAVATLSDDPVHRHVLSVYLIDGVTGLVLYSTSHKRAKGPVYLVHSENWLVYTFFNERFRRTEIVAAEMYEGLIQSNSTVFSSFAVTQLPHVLTQSYILPATPVSMTVTLTERGITNKFLLIGLSNGVVIEVPWILLQPRFPDIPCSPEESCIPYMPEIPLPGEASINYNQTLVRTKGIQVAPARLESTSHVLVYGLDLFYTRVAPSKTFDVLKEDFDHRLIVLVLTGLIIASYVTKHLASKKALRQAWK